MRIKILPQLIANQIAAGEVIERPASVIKELLENSLDAGSQHIQIVVEKSGAQLIRIQDDGFGIHQEDLSLALERHGTSKIHTIDDLERIHSLGFRGEALASIAAVSRVQLISRDVNSEHGWQLRSAPSEITVSPTPIAHPIGTTITIHDLFFNTPARRKFLRSEKTEFLHIEECLTKIALSRFDVSFEFIHNQKKIWMLPKALERSAEELRIKKLCGSVFTAHMIQFDSEMPGIKISGWLGLPSMPQDNLDIQYFYVNGRAVKDRVLAHAIKQAYQHMVGRALQPTYILYLVLDATTVDVNVHPTKHEVRFQQARLIHDFILRAVSEALRQAGDLPEGETISTQQFRYDQPQESTNSMWFEQGNSVLEKTDVSNEAVVAKNYSQKNSEAVKYLGVFFERYLLLTEDQQLILIDIYKAKQLWIETELLLHGASQIKSLVIPESFIVSEHVLKLIEDHLDLFFQCGLMLESLGEQTLMIRGLPACFSGIEISMFVDKFVEKIGKKNIETKNTLIKWLAEFVAELSMPVISARPSVFYEEVKNMAGFKACCRTLTIKEFAALI